MLEIKRTAPNPKFPRYLGTVGQISLDKDSFLYTLESPWNPTKTNPNGIVGVSCIPAGEYQLTIEKSPLNDAYYIFLVNPSLGVDLKTISKANNRAGHCFMPGGRNSDNYGRFILIGTSINQSSMETVSLDGGQEAHDRLMKYMKANNITSAKIGWKQ